MSHFLPARVYPEFRSQRRQSKDDLALKDTRLTELGLLDPRKAPSRQLRTAHGTETVRQRPQRSNSDKLLPPPSTAGFPKGIRGAQPRSSRGMAGILDLDKGRSRRDRTFIGASCVVCEEPLEHTLKGERILQLSCGHVSHEACFYEYIKEFEAQACPTCNAPLGLDSSRGGNVLDLEKLSQMVRQMQEQKAAARGPVASPMPWDRPVPVENPGASVDPRYVAHESIQTESKYGRPSGFIRSEESLHQRADSLQRSGPPSSGYHMRGDSGATGSAPSGDYRDLQESMGRRHDYDVHSMETSLGSPRKDAAKNPIPPPMVTVRSEFPTLTRSRQQQSLTCLVTVEVVEGKWRPNPEDIRPTAPAPMPRLQEPPQRPRSPPPPAAPASNNRLESIYESQEVLDEITQELHSRVENWHGLDFSRFGKLRLHGTIRVGKDRQSWQELECYLFSDMLICVKEKRNQPQQQMDGEESVTTQRKPKCTLKGSILIKKHLKQVECAPDQSLLTLSLSVAELPQFHLQFQNASQLDLWKRALLDIVYPDTPVRIPADYDQDNSGTDEEDYRTSQNMRISSSYGGTRSNYTAPTEYTNSPAGFADGVSPLMGHVPIDLVVVVPISSSMQGLKINLLRDALRFLVQNLGDRDRMGLVTFGSSGGGVPLVGMTTKAWNGWSKVLEAIRPVGQKSLRADVVEGANVAMDLLMQRKSSNPLSSILLISDSSTSDSESVDFVVSRAEAAKIMIHSFGLGLTHKPDTMIELSSRTKASYTYVKDWMMLRECVAGCLGSLQSTSHQNVKLKLRLPEGSPAKFVKTSGALHVTKRATGRDVEAFLGDLRFGDKRDILVQLAIAPDSATPEQVPQDAWETIVSGLEALGGPIEQDEQRAVSVEEVPLLQADLIYGDILREGVQSHLPRPSLLAITMLPAVNKMKHHMTPPIPPHPSVVQRRMELLTSDMLTRALTLVSRGQHERAHHLLQETRSILKGLGKGGLPPVPPPLPPPSSRLPPPPTPTQLQGPSAGGTPPRTSTPPDVANDAKLRKQRTPSPTNGTGTGTDGTGNGFAPAAGIDQTTMASLDAELDAALEWINHPAVFGRDSRKAVLQAIGVISSQRGYTFRTPSEALWAARVAGIKKLAERSREWREAGDDALMEE